MGGGDQGDTYMTPGMLQNHATRAFSAYRALGGPDMATTAIDIAQGWLHNVQSGQKSHKMEVSEQRNILRERFKGNSFFSLINIMVKLL